MPAIDKRRIFVCVAIVLSVSMLCTALPARAEQTAAPSLQLVPADASFYSVMLRNRQQFQAIAHSRAWARLKQNPLVQMGWKQLHAALAESPAAGFQGLLQAPENRELLGVLADMFSDEWFCYGGSDFTDFAKLVNDLSGGPNAGLASLQGAASGSGVNRKWLRDYLQTLAADINYIKAPDLVVGFHVNKPAAVQPQLKRLAGFLTGLLTQNSNLGIKFETRKIEGNDFLTVIATTEAVPWDTLPLDDIEETPGEFEPVIKKLKKLKATISLGVRNDYVLFAIGSSDAAILRLGMGTKLATSSDLKPVIEAASKPLTAISYVSKALRQQTGYSDAYLARLQERIQRTLAPLISDEEKRKQLHNDLTELRKAYASSIPRYGALVEFSYLTGSGMESYSYDHTEYPGLDSSRRLSLLEHAGGTPLFVSAHDAKVSVAGYNTLAKWLRTANRYFEELLIPQLDPDARERYETITKWAHPLLRRFDEVNRTLLVPSLQGQDAFVIDGKTSSHQWVHFLPPAQEPLPLVAPSVVLAIKDVDLFRRACAEYRTMVNEALKQLPSTVSENIPELELPPPETRKIDAGTIYYYNLPMASQFDDAFLPNAGLSDHVLCLTLSESISKRLLQRTPLKVASKLLTDNDGRLCSAAYLDWAGTVDALTPWVKYGARLLASRRDRQNADSDDEKKPAMNTDMLFKQAEPIVALLKVLRSYTSASYMKDGTLITHSETVIHDVD